MRKRSRTVAGALAAVFAVVVGWSLWVMRDPGPAVSPAALRQTEKPAESPPARLGSDRPAPRAESGVSEPVVEKVADGSAARTHPDAMAVGVPPAMVAGDFPPYLAVVADARSISRDPRGCKTPYKLLLEMSEEPRDDLWAPRVERELRAMLGQHPLGFPVSVGCRATICQITAIGQHAALPGNEGGDGPFWSNFMDKLRSSPVASEFAISRFFGGLFPGPEKIRFG